MFSLGGGYGAFYRKASNLAPPLLVLSPLSARPNVHSQEPRSVLDKSGQGAHDRRRWRLVVATKRRRLVNGPRDIGRPLSGQLFDIVLCRTRQTQFILSMENCAKHLPEFRPFSESNVERQLPIAKRRT